MLVLKQCQYKIEVSVHPLRDNFADFTLGGRPPMWGRVLFIYLKMVSYSQFADLEMDSLE